MTSLFDNVDIVKSGKNCRIPSEKRCNIQFSIENAKYIILKTCTGVHISNSVGIRRRVNQSLGE